MLKKIKKKSEMNNIEPKSFTKETNIPAPPHGAGQADC
jgi:hypothetical protein